LTPALIGLAVAPALAVGSFLNVVVARVPLRRSLIAPSSCCMECGAQIAWYDNVPVASWLLLAGRCRQCRARISARYPAVELLTTLLIVGCLVAFGVTAYTLLAAGFCTVLVALAAIDIDHRIVPNRIVIPAAAVVLVAHTVLDPSPEWALGALGASGFLFLAALAYPSGMGMGDVKLALLLGAMVGRSVGLALMLGFIFALVPSFYLLLRHGMKARKMALPLVPFLALGSVVALFAGGTVMDWYAGMLG
jgi:leader peptidase (prepilin peptidase)/N-methyltransferase